MYLLRENARLSDEQIARRLGLPVDEVRSIVAQLEHDKIIVGYKAIINPELLDEEVVDAMIEVRVTPKRGHGFDHIAKRIYGFPEVQTVYLMSGGSDFLVFIQGKSIKTIAKFIAEKLSSLEDVVGTTTHFVLKKYKQDGVILHEEEVPNRLAVTP